MGTVTPRRSSLTERLRSERGVSLIHVGIAIFVVMGFSAFVLDHGVMLVARGQAQNVADAAAIAAVTTRVMDEPGSANPAVNGITEKVLVKTVESNDIFGGAATDTGRTWEWGCPTGITGWCVQVSVFRDGTNGSTTLPVYFAPLFGLSSQSVRAYAAAVASNANGTGCMKPWLIPDKWLELQNPANAFNPPGDIYTPYNYQTNTPGTGYSLADIGMPVVLKPGNPANTISPSDFFEIEDANDYEQSIINCLITKNIGDTVWVLPGNRVGPTNQGVDALLANGPVTVVIGMFDPAQFEMQKRTSGSFQLTIVNMIGVRLERRNGNQIEGYISGGIGTNTGTGGAPGGVANLIKVISLVR